MDCCYQQSTLYVRTYSVIKKMGNNMIDFDDIHFIENGDVSLLLHVPSFTLVSLSSDTANILKSLKEGASISDVAQNSSISLDEIKNCLLKLEDMFKKNLPHLIPNPTTDVVDRITLHISKTARRLRTFLPVWARRFLPWRSCPPRWKKSCATA